MEALMRAKLEVSQIEKHNEASETVHMHAVCANGYDETGLDEDNTYAKFSPQADFSICVMNPALLGKFHVGQRFYVDFTEAPPAAVQPALP